MATDRSPFEPRVLVALDALVDAFERRGIRYALIGGLAVSVRAEPRMTRDIDFLLTIPQLVLPGLVEELAGRGFELDESAVVAEFVRHHMAAFDYQGVGVDWLKPVLPAYQHVLDRAGVEKEFGRPVRVATAEGLILLKLPASRPRDLMDIEALLTINQGQLDLAWVEQEWLTLFPADDPRWQRFRQLVAEVYKPHPGPA
jgi:hypothetical protein